MTTFTRDDAIAAVELSKHVIIPEDFTSIEDRAFIGLGILSVMIRDSVTSIGDFAFAENQLASVFIGIGVTSIGNAAFANNQLTSVTIPDSVTSIGNAAFESNQLTSVTIPDSVTSIGNHAFYNNQLTSVTIPDSVTSIASIGTYPFDESTIVTIESSSTYILPSYFDNLTLTGTAAINGTGNTANNTLTGNSGNNILDGGEGNDTMVGGAGDDTYKVDAVGDVVTEAASAGTDTVQSSVTYTLAANVENLTLTGTAAINGTGNTLNNVLTGNSTKNTLNGGTGNDSIIGGGGQDKLTGGTGLDKFIYNSVNESGVGSSLRDTITDFKGLTDKDLIDLSAIDAFTGAVGDQAFVYIGSNAFTGTRGEVRFSGGVLQMNTGTDKSADMEIALTGVTSFSQNFLVL